MRAIRGGEIGLVFQEPMSSLSAFHTVGNQLIEAIRLHSHLVEARGAGARDRAAGDGRHSASGAAGGCLFVRTVRRPAAARDDRAGAGRRTAHPDRRRADHRAGRHDAGADPGADPPAAAGARAGGDPDHPRHGRDRRDGRRRRGDVSRATRSRRARWTRSSTRRGIRIRVRCCGRSPACWPSRGRGWRRSPVRSRIPMRGRRAARSIRAARTSSLGVCEKSFPVEVASPSATTWRAISDRAIGEAETRGSIWGGARGRAIERPASPQARLRKAGRGHSSSTLLCGGPP